MSALIDSFSEPNEDKCEMCNCDLKTRLIGGCITMAVGCLFCFLSFIPFHRRDMVGFSISYVIGSSCALASTFFFAGWKKQWKELKNNRPFLCSAIAIVVSILLILIVGNAASGAAATIFCVIFVACHWVAQVFYGITSIPGGWTAVKTLFTSCCK